MRARQKIEKEFRIPNLPRKIDDVIRKAENDPSLATVLRKLFQEIEHLAYRKVAIREREENDARRNAG